MAARASKEMVEMGEQGGRANWESQPERDGAMSGVQPREVEEQEHVALRRVRPEKPGSRKDPREPDCA